MPEWVTFALESMVRLLPGLWGSLQMAAASLAFGLPLGFLAGLALNSRHRWLRWPVVGLVETFRGFPALLTLYLVYFGIADFIALDRFPAVVIAFGLTSGAYAAEIFRSTIASVPRGQLEAADALGFSWGQRVRIVILPQVLMIATPPLIGICVIAFQGTALAYAIGGRELLGTAFSYGMLSFKVLPELTVAAAMFFLVTVALSGLEGLAARRAARVNGHVASPVRRGLRSLRTSPKGGTRG